MIENINKKIYLACWKSFVPWSLRLRNNPAFPNNGPIKKNIYISITNYEIVKNSKSEPKISHACLTLRWVPLFFQKSAIPSSTESQHIPLPLIFQEHLQLIRYDAISQISQFANSSSYNPLIRWTHHLLRNKICFFLTCIFFFGGGGRGSSKDLW
jgi:hypothetical protein